MPRPDPKPLDSVSSCPVCNVNFVLFTRKVNCTGCGEVFCKKCCNNWLHLPEDYNYAKPQRVCLQCFKNLSLLDHSVTYDVFGPEEAPVLILLHPATVTRKFWTPIIDTLATSFRVYAIDLPAHGSRMDEKMNLQNAHNAISTIIKDFVAPKKCALWGHEAGGYIAISYGGLNPDDCIGIVASNACGARDEKASELKMAALSLLHTIKWNSVLAESPLTFLQNNQIDQQTMQNCFLRCGSYFHGWDGLLETTHIKNYLELIRCFSGKLFFINGSLVERGAEERFLGAAQEASIEVIKDAADWFVIDNRFRDRSLNLVMNFLKNLEWRDYNFEFPPEPSPPPPIESEVENPDQDLAPDLNPEDLSDEDDDLKRQLDQREAELKANSQQPQEIEFTEFKRASIPSTSPISNELESKNESEQINNFQVDEKVEDTTSAVQEPQEPNNTVEVQEPISIPFTESEPESQPEPEPQEPNNIVDVQEPISIPEPESELQEQENISEPFAEQNAEVPPSTEEPIQQNLGHDKPEFVEQSLTDPE